MKKIFLLVVSLIISGMASAQKDSLSLDEHNKYIYYQVVDRLGVSADSLQKSVAYFVKDMYPKNKSVQITQYGANIKDKFLTYTSLVKRENGEMAYALTIECKEGRYRYWLTDFVFTPYEKNRYGVFVPVSGIDIPIENASSKLTQKDVDAYFDQTGAFCKQLGQKLKKYMAEEHSVKKPDQQPVKKIVTDKW
jgi:Domain of unknown function (DUF4468) with TBP-like fold